MYFYKSAAIREGQFSDFDYTFGNRHFGKGGTFFKGIISDFVKSLRQMKIGKSIAARKGEFPNFFTLSGIISSFSDSHPIKALAPISVSSDGRVTSVSEEQNLKVEALKTLTSSGIIIFSETDIYETPIRRFLLRWRVDSLQ